MSGCRSLNNNEIQQVLAQLNNVRDKALFILGVKTGFRISELLSLKVNDVVQAGQILDRIKVAKSNTKGKNKSREVVLHPQAKEALALLDLTNPDTALFSKKDGTSLSRHGAHKLLKIAYSKAGLTGALATHSMRKSFAKRVYSNLKHDLLATRDALGHSSITNTISYLETNQTAIDAAVLAA